MLNPEMVSRRVGGLLNINIKVSRWRQSSPPSRRLRDHTRSLACIAPRSPPDRRLRNKGDGYSYKRAGFPPYRRLIKQPAPRTVRRPSVPPGRRFINFQRGSIIDGNSSPPGRRLRDTKQVDRELVCMFPAGEAANKC